nr:hypothetical protein [uncultured Rhodopila sp.]
MTRMSRLASSVLAVSLTVLPVAAFAQQAAAPVQAAVPAVPAAKTAVAALPNTATETKAPKTATTDVKTPPIGKTVTGVKPLTAGPATPAHTVPAKPADTNKF